MTIGPVQLIVLGFPEPDFHGAIIEELERLRQNDTIRVVDALAVHKKVGGDIEVAHLSNLSDEEAVEFGTAIGALIGLGIEGEEGLEGRSRGGGPGRPRTASTCSPMRTRGTCSTTSPRDRPPRSSCSTHLWAVPLRNAVAAAGGFRISDGFISPLDLIAIGLVSQQEASELHALENTAVGAS